MWRAFFVVFLRQRNSFFAPNNDSFYGGRKVKFHTKINYLEKRTRVAKNDFFFLFNVVPQKDFGAAKTVLTDGCQKPIVGKTNR